MHTRKVRMCTEPYVHLSLCLFGWHRWVVQRPHTRDWKFEEISDKRIFIHLERQRQQPHELQRDGQHFVVVLVHTRAVPRRGGGPEVLRTREVGGRWEGGFGRVGLLGLEGAVAHCEGLFEI